VIASHRDKQGGLKTIEDLKRVPDLDAAKVDALAPPLVFSNPPSDRL
jgi:DNA uptake protein ComE-like DNA-binding protein